MSTPPADTTLLRTSISRNWLIKMAVFLIALLGFGTWGLVDALVIYPRKGLEDASFKLKNYLQAASASNRLSPTALKLDDPAAELSSLAKREPKAGGPKDTLTDLELAKLAWLRALDRAWKLNAPENPIGNASRPKLGPDGTEIYQGVGGSVDAQKEIHRVLFRTREGTGVAIAPDGKRADLSADQVLKDLTAYWTAQKRTPSALEFYDLPSQWVFVAIGYGGAIYIVALLFIVSRRRFQFDPDAKRLVLPSGESITPDDIKELDKRRWHKFFVTLVTKDNRSHTFDLLRYVPLEQWILEMEKRAFPEIESTDGADAAGDSADDAAASTENGAAKPHKKVGAISSMTYGGVPDGVFVVLLFDPAAREGSEDYPAYAQAETLKALAASLSKEQGWNLWLTAGAGIIGGTGAHVAGGPSLGVRSLVEWIDNKGFGYQIDASRLDAAMNGKVQNLAMGSADASTSPYAVTLGRITPTTAARLHDTMMDPPTRGYAGLLIVKSNPATIERLTQPLELEGGLEIKGGECVGAWKASAAEIEQAGLSLPEAAQPD